jgi:hypothetical protein
MPEDVTSFVALGGDDSKPTARRERAAKVEQLVVKGDCNRRFGQTRADRGRHVGTSHPGGVADHFPIGIQKLKVQKALPTG